MANRSRLSRITFTVEVDPDYLFGTVQELAIELADELSSFKGVVGVWDEVSDDE